MDFYNADGANTLKLDMDSVCLHSDPVQRKYTRAVTFPNFFSLSKHPKAHDMDLVCLLKSLIHSDPI